MNEFYAREFWRVVLVQQEVSKLASTAVDYPPIQAPASFNGGGQTLDQRDDQGPRRTITAHRSKTMA
jgi:hypothetical protein